MSDPVVEDFSIEVEELTQATVSGNGVFDVLMRAVKEHIEQEHKLGRIRGPEYATVYLGALESTMNTALQFLLQQQKAALEAEQIKAQILLIQAQIAKTEVEKEMLEAQLPKIAAEIALTEKQGQRLDAEKELLVQKKLTETAQTNGTGVTTDSVIGRQNALYQAQTEGFERDAEQKAAKIMIDTWTVRRTTDEGTVADTVNKLSDITVGKAVTKLLAGVDVVA